MQQQKFATAELLLQGNEAEKAKELRDRDILAKARTPEPSVRRGSQEYLILKNTYLKEALLSETAVAEEGIQLILDSRIKKVTCRKIKYKMLTNEHGSMRASDMLQKRLELVEKEKEKENTAEKKKKQKVAELDAFIRCSTRCVCIQGSSKCSAKNLKRCSNCQEVKRSQCSKLKCRSKDGGKLPQMMLPASAAGKNMSIKRRVSEVFSSSSVEDDITSIHSGDEDGGDIVHDLSLDQPGIPEETRTPQEDCAQLKDFWRTVSPPVKEEDVIGKWYTAVYEEAGVKTMIVGRALKRFLDEEGGKATHIELDCLRPQVGSGCTLKGYPDTQHDIYVYQMQDVIGGPLRCLVPKKNKEWCFPDIQAVCKFFRKVKDVDRSEVLAEFDIDS